MKQARDGATRAVFPFALQSVNTPG